MTWSTGSIVQACSCRSTQFSLLMTDHPTVAKVASVALAAIGMGIVSIPCTDPHLSLNVLASCTITGVSLTTVSGYLFGLIHSHRKKRVIDDAELDDNLHQIVPHSRSSIYDYYRSRFFKEAVIKGDLEAIGAFFPRVAVISQDDQGEVVRYAAFRGYLDVVKGLLAHNALISQQDLGWALREAAFKGHVKVFRELLSYGAAMSEYDRQEAVKDAARHGHLDVIKEFFSSGVVISQTAREQIIEIAAALGDLDMVRYLIPHCVVRSEDHPTLAVGRAVVLATRCGCFIIGPDCASTPPVRAVHLEVIKELLASGATIPNQWEGEVLDYVGLMGDIELFRSLIARFSTIYQHALEGAFISAARYGRIEVVRELLSGHRELGQTSQNWAIREAVFEEHLREAVFEEHLGVVPELLAGGDHSFRNDQGWAIFNAAFRGDLGLVRELCAGLSTMSHFDLGEAVKVAAQRGYLDIVRALFSSGATISNQQRGLAVILAAKNGHLEVIKELLSGGIDLSQNNRQKAITNAGNNGHLAVVQFLLQQYPLTPSQIEPLVLSVSARGHGDVLHYLLEQGPVRVSVKYFATLQAGQDRLAVPGSREAILDVLAFDSFLSQDDRGEAVIDAAKHGCLKIVTELLVGGSISQSARAEAVKRAAEYNPQVRTLNNNEHFECYHSDVALDMIRALLSGGATISDNERGLAVIEAAENGYSGVVRYLLAHGAFISQKHRADAVQAAAQTCLNDSLGVIRELLALGAVISEHDRGEAVQSAALAGNLEVIKELLSGGNLISQDHREGAVKLVANTFLPNALEVIRELLSGGFEMSEQGRLETVKKAAQQGHLAIVQFLLQGHHCPQRTREELVLAVASRGHRDLLEYFLQQGPIGMLVRESAITQAGRQGPPGSRAAILGLLEMAEVIPDAPRAGVAAGTGEEGTLYTTFEEVKTDPARFLELMSGSFPLRVVLTNNPQAIDLGGVTKQLITTLMEALVDKDIIQRNDQLLPTATSETAPSMHQMGRFFSALFTRNRDRTDKFVTGPLVHPLFFDLVKMTLQEGSFENKLKQIAQAICEIDPALELAKKALIDPSDPKNIVAYRDIMGAEANPQEMFMGYFKAAEAFGTGLSEEFKAQLQRADCKAFITQIQGELITTAQLLEVCHVMGREPGFIEKAEWVKEALRKADTNWLKQFVFAITGNHVVPREIEIRPGWREAFELHTCFNSLDLPNGSMAKEDFLEALNAVIQGNGYNIA